jgi:peroxiredoxin
MRKIMFFALCALLCLQTAAHAVIKKGQKLPAFSITTADGVQVPSETFRGKVLLLAVSSDGCNHCKSAIPYLNRLDKVYSPMGMQVQGLIYGPGVGKDSLKRYQDGNKVSYPLAFSSSKEIYDTIGAYSVPTYLLIDKKGQLAGYFRGFSYANMNLIEHQAKSLLAQ